MLERKKYMGRFAPSPTGPLHFGSLIAAMGSYLEARAKGGEWLLRIEDLDGQREVAGAADAIILTLEKLGFEWDQALTYQSQRTEIYRKYLAGLERNGQIYNCSCSRKDVQLLAGRGRFGLIYPGTCRERPQHDTSSHAIRVTTHDQSIGFDDALLGHYQQRLQSEIGDFVLLRADGFVAYQLAVVIDDALQGITEVVRGADLLDNTPRQIHLQQLLDFQTPNYAHLPVATNSLGQKLSKQTGAMAIDHEKPIPLILQGLDFLNQELPREGDIETLDDLWQWAIKHWDLKRVPRKSAVASSLLP